MTKCLKWDIIRSDFLRFGLFHTDTDASDIIVITSAQLSSEANTGVIVALAVGPVDASEAGGVTHTLSAVALALAAAYLGLIAGLAVARQSTLLIALAARAHEARLTHAHAALESPLPRAALAAVSCLWGRAAVTRAERVQLDVQRVLQPDRFEEEVSRGGQAVGQLHCDIEHHLRREYINMRRAAVTGEGAKSQQMQSDGFN